MTTMGKEASLDRQAEVWKPEDIINEKSFTENIVPYGNSQDQLVPGLHYPAPAAGGQLFSGAVTYTTTGTKTVSGVGFLPRLVKITSTLTTGAISHGRYFGGSVSCSYYFTGGGAGDSSGNIGYSAYLDNTGNPTIATTITPTSDGFTIVINNVSGGAVTMIYECYG